MLNNEEMVSCYKNLYSECKKKGNCPVIFPGYSNYGPALEAYDEVYDLPEYVKEYMSGNYANGFPHFAIIDDSPGRVYFRLGSVSGPVKYPVGPNTLSTAARRSGALKRGIMAAWKRGQEEGLL